MKKFVIIVAGGKGLRMNSELPKQFIPIAGKPILMHTLNAFYEYENNIKIILVLPVSQISFWESLCKEYDFDIEHEIAVGGETRFHSVKNGLEKVDDNGLAAVHDGVRPFVNKKTIEKCFSIAEEKGNAIPVVELVDSIRKIENDKNFSVNRSDYKLVQTPQVFDVRKLKESYQKALTADVNQFTDDASVFAFAGNDIYLVEGNRENIKVTTEFDLKMGECLCGF